MIPRDTNRLQIRATGSQILVIAKVIFCFLILGARGFGASFDAAPFALPLPEGNGLIWEDPREIHQVSVKFAGPAPAAKEIHLEYWGSRWPEQHLPKDQAPGGGDVGWMELGNWHRGGWRTADTEAKAEGASITFSFHPVNAKEFPKLKDYAADFRYTLKLRLVSEASLPKIERFEAFTDSTLATRNLTLAWSNGPASDPIFTAFNGAVLVKDRAGLQTRIQASGTINTDPNT